LEILVLEYWKGEHRFPYLKAASQELLGMTATSATSERVFNHASEMHCEKRGNLGILFLAILMCMRTNPHLGMNLTLIKVALICVNITLIGILVQFLFFEIPLILILI